MTVQIAFQAKSIATTMKADKESVYLCYLLIITSKKVVSITSILSCSDPFNECFATNKQYSGSDLILNFSTDGPDECQEACQDHTWCVYFTWLWKGLAQTSHCYLKWKDKSANAEECLPHQTCIGGPKYCPTQEQPATTEANTDTGCFKTQH